MPRASKIWELKDKLEFKFFLSLVSLLKVVYHMFSNPATSSFAWIGAEEAEVIFLNDFCWQPKIITWADFLKALEGDIVPLPAPKNVRSRYRTLPRYPVLCDIRCATCFSDSRLHRPRKHGNDEFLMGFFLLLEQIYVGKRCKRSEQLIYLPHNSYDVWLSIVL